MRVAVILMIVHAMLSAFADLDGVIYDAGTAVLDFLQNWSDLATDLRRRLGS